MALAAALAVLLPALAAAQVPVPRLTGPVVDTAGLLDAGTRSRLGELARSARARDSGEGVQLQYCIVPSLGGESIEDFSIRVAEAWKLGTKGRDNGLLVTVAVKDRQFRIEVGGGLEGEIPDVLARRIGDQIIRPAFQQGRYGDGLYDAGAQLLTLARVAPEEVARHAVGVTTDQGRRQAPPGSVTGMPSFGGVIAVLFMIIWVIGVVSRGFGSRRRSHLWWGGGGGPWSGGGWGGGGGGGGGWSGGGGGFSGGGASGRW